MVLRQALLYFAKWRSSQPVSLQALTPTSPAPHHFPCSHTTPDATATMPHGGKQPMPRSKDFIQRSYSIWFNQKKRAQQKGQHINYDVEDLRQHIEEALPQGCSYCHVALRDT